jgi:glycosyltransferase involved in cell wall biosynthesis
MIPTYNCITFLETTLKSVLDQDWGEELMQIEVIDDCSTDGNVEALVQEVGKGRIGYFRQEINRGSLRNFETCINRAKGEWVHLLHGDDCIKSGFYKEIEKLFKAFPEAGAALTKHSIMDETGTEKFSFNFIDQEFGIVDNWLEKIAQQQLLNPPAIVVKRSVYEKLGSFFAVHYGEDWEMWARIGTHYKVAYSPANLALYRLHGNNITSRSFATGQNIRDIEKVIEIIQTYLPTNKRKELKRKAKRYFSIYFTKSANKILRKQHNPQIALKQARGALAMHVNRTTIKSFVTLYVKSKLGLYK